MVEWMDRWMDGWMDGWILDGWVDEIFVWLYPCIVTGGIHISVTFSNVCHRAYDLNSSMAGLVSSSFSVVSHSTLEGPEHDPWRDMCP